MDIEQKVYYGFASGVESVAEVLWPDGWIIRSVTGTGTHGYVLVVFEREKF